MKIALAVVSLMGILFGFALAAPQPLEATGSANAAGGIAGVLNPVVSVVGNAASDPINLVSNIINSVLNLVGLGNKYSALTNLRPDQFSVVNGKGDVFSILQVNNTLVLAPQAAALASQQAKINSGNTANIQAGATVNAG